MSERSFQATARRAREAACQIALMDMGIGDKAQDSNRFVDREPLRPDSDVLSRGPDVGRLGFAGAAVLLVVLALIGALLPYT